MVHDRLNLLSADAWRHFSAMTDRPESRVYGRDAPARVTAPSVVQPSAPVLYFGDLDTYLQSPLRVVTVGVNPSGQEFRADKPWARFPCEGFSGMAGEQAAYLTVLNGYFERPEPYRGWFDRSYEPVLNGMQASFYSSLPNRAIHTDVCSPLATNPTWSGLSREERIILSSVGVPLWHKLVETLQPDVILASVSAAHFGRIVLPAASKPEVIYVVEQKRPCEVRAQRVTCGEGAALLVWGAAATTPFQMIDHAHKRALGETIARIIAGG